MTPTASEIYELCKPLKDVEGLWPEDLGFNGDHFYDEYDADYIRNHFAAALLRDACVRWLASKGILRAWNCGDHFHVEVVGANVSVEHNDSLLHALVAAVLATNASPPAGD